MTTTQIKTGDTFYMHRQSVLGWTVVGYDERSDSYRVSQPGDLSMSVSASYLLGHEGGWYRDIDGTVTRIA